MVTLCGRSKGDPKGGTSHPDVQHYRGEPKEIALSSRGSPALFDSLALTSWATLALPEIAKPSL